MSRPVVLLAGQSNACGLAPYSGLPASVSSPFTSVDVYCGGDVDPAKAGAWLALAGGFGYTGHTAFGPELTFGIDIESYYRGTNWAIIKHGVGGTALATDWDPTTGATYAAFVATVAAGLAAIGEEYEVAGMLWMQGESDGMTLAYANAYATNLAAFIAAVRALVSRPRLPFAIAKINTYTDWPYAATVRAAQDAVAAADPLVTAFEAADLTQIAPGGHFDTDGMVTLGQRFAVALGGLFVVNSPSRVFSAIPIKV